MFSATSGVALLDQRFLKELVIVGEKKLVLIHKKKLTLTKSEVLYDQIWIFFNANIWFLFLKKHKATNVFLKQQ